MSGALLTGPHFLVLLVGCLLLVAATWDRPTTTAASHAEQVGTSPSQAS